MATDTNTAHADGWYECQATLRGEAASASTQPDEMAIDEWEKRCWAELGRKSRARWAEENPF
jgi:hypothetical protein